MRALLRWSASLCAVALAVGAIAVGTVRAGGFSSLDFGARRMGMMAVVGKPDDGTAIFNNPAAMTLLDGTQIYHHQSWILADLEFKLYDSEGQLRPERNLSPDWSLGVLPYLSVTTDLGLEDFRFGLALFAPNGYGASMPDDAPTRYHATSALFVAARSTFAAAYEVSDWFSVGASLSVVYVYLSAERVLNLGVLADPDKRFLPVSETQQSDGAMSLDGQDWTWAWDVGLYFTPMEDMHFSFSFASGSDISLDGDVKVKWFDDSVDRSRHETGLVIPFTLRAGFNWEFVEDFEIGVDFVYWHYQTFQEQRSTLSRPIRGISEFVDAKAYGNGFLWCIGLLYRVLPELELMVGYQEDYTPIPEQAFTLENPSRDQKSISFGARWWCTPKVRLGFGFERLWFELVDIQTSGTVPPSNAKGHGGMSMFGLDVTWVL